MRLITDGLIIRQTDSVGEADRFITVLTRQLGVIRISARGARRSASRSAAATRLLTYSELVIGESKNKYYLDDAKPLRVFFELHSDLERLALAQYFCELAGVLAPREEPAEDALRLLLNALFLLGEKRLPLEQIKAVTELRLLAQGGYMPQLNACAICGTPIDDKRGWRLRERDGVVVCSVCDPPPDAKSMAYELSVSVMAAMRHAMSAPINRCFSFTLPEADLIGLHSVAERLLLEQVGHHFSTLDFYHGLANI